MIKLLLKHEGESREMELSQPEISLGRSTENTIALNDKKASRLHAKIQKDGDIYRLIDLGSGNGTKVNGRDVNTHVLGQGDEIQIGFSTVTVLAVDAPSLVRHAPAPVAAAAAASPAKAPESHGEAIKKHTRRGHYAGRSSSNSMVAFAAAALVIGAVVWVLYEKAGSVSVRPTTVVMAEKKKDSIAKEAEPAYAAFKARTESETPSDALIAEGSTLVERFGALKPEFETLVAQLKQRRAEQIGKMAFSQVEGLVQAALKERRFGDALDALKALKGTPDAAQAAALAVKVTEEIGKEFRAVDEQGKKLAAEKQYTQAAEHYRSQAKSFRATEHFKYLFNKPEMLDDLAQTELAVETAKAQKTAAPPPLLAKAPEPKPEPPKPILEAPKPAMPKEPEKPAMTAPKPAMPAPKPTPKPPEPKPATPKPPEPKPDPDAKPAEGANTRYKKPEVLCDCKKILKGTYCVKCERTLVEDDLRKGLCKKCEEKPKKIDLCVKRYFQAECHPEKISERPVICDGKIYDFPHEDKARIVHLCETCDEWGEMQSEIKHKPECKNRLSTTKVCLKSGQGAHTNKDK